MSWLHAICRWPIKYILSYKKLRIIVRNFSVHFNKPINVRVTFLLILFSSVFLLWENTLFQVIWMVPASFCFSHMDLFIYHLIKIELFLKDKYVLFLVSNWREKDCSVGCCFSLWKKNFCVLLLFLSYTSYKYDMYIGCEKYGAPENKGALSKKTHLACIWEERSKEWN